MIQINKKVLFLLLISLILFNFGCTQASHVESTHNQPSSHRASLQIHLEDVTYIESDSSALVHFKTTLPTGIFGTLSLIDNEEMILGWGQMMIEEKENQTGEIRIYNNQSFVQELAEVYIVFEFNVSYLESQNTSFLHNPNGGSGQDLIAHHKSKESVMITLNDNKNPSEDYSVQVLSESINIGNSLIADSERESSSKVSKDKLDSLPQTENPVETELLSNDFAEYNKNFYEVYLMQNNLIASNFEILAMDGFSNRDILKDLIVWLEEFNNLLIIYEKESTPINSIDTQLFDITNEMIKNQQIVNESLLTSLRDENDLFLYDEEAIRAMNRTKDFYEQGQDFFNNNK